MKRAKAQRPDKGPPFKDAAERRRIHLAYFRHGEAHRDGRGCIKPLWYMRGILLGVFRFEPDSTPSRNAVELWLARRPAIRFIHTHLLRAYRYRNDPVLGVHASEALRTAVAALKTYHPYRPDLGATAFDEPFYRFQASWNALVAARALDRPRRAGLARRAFGDETRDEVTAAWQADSGKERGRIGRVAIKLRMPEATVRLALETAGIRKPKKRKPKRK